MDTKKLKTLQDRLRQVIVEHERKGGQIVPGQVPCTVLRKILEQSEKST